MGRLKVRTLSVGCHLLAVSMGALAVIGSFAPADTLASAAPQGPWLPPERLSDSQRNSSDPQIAIAPDGTATVAWSRSDGYVQTATRPPGGSFGPGTNIPLSGGSGVAESVPPRIGVAQDGTVTVAWKRYVGSGYVVSAAVRPPGGVFGSPIDVSAVAGVNSLWSLDLAVASDGTTTVIWSRRTVDGDLIVESSTRPPNAGFSSPVNLSGTGSATDPRVEVAKDGTATVVWFFRENGPDAPTVVQASTRAPGGAFGPAATISTPAGQGIGLDIAVANDGTTTVVWDRKDSDGPGSQPNAIKASTRSPGGSFGTEVEVPGSRPLGIDPRIAFSPDGSSVVAWTYGENQDSSEVRLVSRQPGGEFGSSERISPDDQSFGGPKVAVAGDGTVTVISSRVNGSRGLHAATRPPNGTFGPQVRLSGSSLYAGYSQMAVAPDGSVTVVWTNRNATEPYDSRIESASTQTPSFSLVIAKSGSGTGTVSSDPEGISCGSVCSGDFLSYARVSLEALPDEGSRFAGWSGAGCSGNETCEVGISAAAQVTANFESIPRTLETSTAGSGSGLIESSPAGIVCGDQCRKAFNHGTIVTLTATSGPDSTFAGWSGAGCSGAPTCQVTLTSDLSTTATFDAIPFAKAEISRVKVLGPAKLVRGKRASLKVRIGNSGSAQAAGVRLVVSGRGIRHVAPIGLIDAGSTRTISVPLRPKRTGRIATTFTVTSTNASAKTIRKTFEVRRYRRSRPR